MGVFSLWAASALTVATAAAVSIADINGNSFRSPYAGQSLTNISGLVTAKSSTGFFLRSLDADTTTTANNNTASDSIFVFSSTAGQSLSVGDAITLNARVTDYRSSTAYLFLTELSSPTSVQIVSRNNTVTPRVIGVDTASPPTTFYSSLDQPNGDIYALPNAAALLTTANPARDPATYGLDFWQSLLGELVTIRNVSIIARPNSYDETWITSGDWPVTGRSARGSLTMSPLDSNPESIIVGDALDGTANPTTPKIGDKAADLTGVVYQQFGFYYLLPLTALTLTDLAEGTAPPTTLTSARSCEAITIGDYNVENLVPTADKIPALASQIIDSLGAPDLLFVQEIQDNSGATDDGTVDATQTLSNLVAALADAGNVTYDFAVIDPVDDQDGGEPGGNIRVAYLYRPDVISLYNPNIGNSTAATEVLAGPALSLNPGRVAPLDAAWDATRKPLAAAWTAAGASKPFFTVNVHWSSKGGGSSLQGDARPPVNGAVAKRLAQANVTGSFIAEILAADADAAVIAAGDFNEFEFVAPLQQFASVSGLAELDEVVGTPLEERYTYTFDMNTQALDHMYVSPVLAAGAATAYEHVHLNTWAAAADVLSDHDPSVAVFNLCG